MTFSHPLARAAKVWRAKTHDGGEQRLLVIVTTIPLDEKSKQYKKGLVERLSNAAQKYLTESAAASGFVLINRMRDWAGEKA
jgi:hypothetical protein